MIDKILKAIQNPVDTIKKQFSKIKLVLLWILFGVSALGAWAYFPSVSSILFTIVAIASIPIEIFQRLIQLIKIPKALRIMLIGILFVIALLIAPIDTDTNPDKNTPPNTNTSTITNVVTWNT